MLASLPSMGRQGGKDTPRPAPRHRTERPHHKRRGSASFAGVRGVEEALRHLFHPSNDGADASPENRRCGGRRIVAHRLRHDSTRYRPVRQASGYGLILRRRRWRPWGGDRSDAVGECTHSLCDSTTILLANQ